MQVYKIVKILDDGSIQESFINTGMTEEEKIFKAKVAEIIDLANDVRSKSANIDKNFDLLGDLPNELDLDMVHYVDPREGSMVYALFMSILVPLALMLFLYLSQCILKKEWFIRSLPENIKMVAHRFTIANTALFRDNDTNEDLHQDVPMILNYKVVIMAIGFLLINLHTTKLLMEWTSVPRISDEIPNELNQSLKLESYLTHHRRGIYQIYTKAQNIERTIAELTLKENHQIVSYYHVNSQLEKAFDFYYKIFVIFYKISLDHYGRHAAYLMSSIYFFVALTILFIKLWNHPDLRMRGVIHDIIGVAYIIIYGVLVIAAYQMFLIPIYQENVHPDSSILACNFWQQLKLW